MAGGLGIEAFTEFFVRAIGGHGQLASQADRLIDAAGFQTQLQDAALDAAPGGGQGVRAVGGGHHHQLFGPVGEQLAKRQRDHAAVGTAYEGRDLFHAEVVQQQGQQPRLVLGSDGQWRLGVLGVGTEIRREIKGQDAETGQVDGRADAHGAGPPPQALGLGAVDVAVCRDAAGHDDQGGAGLAVQTAHDLLLVQGTAEIEREAVRDRHDDVMSPVARQQLGRTACGGGPTGGRLGRGDGVDQGQGHGSRHSAKRLAKEPMQ